MTQRFKFVALTGVQFHDDRGIHRVSPKTNNGTGLFNAPFTQEKARELIANGNIRIATEKDHASDRALIDLDDDEPEAAQPAIASTAASTPAATTYTAKMKSPGRFGVVDAAGNFVTDEVFKNKADANAWIEANPPADDPFA